VNAIRGKFGRQAFLDGLAQQVLARDDTNHAAEGERVKRRAEPPPPDLFLSSQTGRCRRLRLLNSSSVDPMDTVL
jgi:hypothetical protein